MLAAAPTVAGTPKVVASIKPVHSLAAGVMQGVGEPLLLIEGAASPHGYSLRPSKARALASADLVFWVGPALESSLNRPIAALAGDALVVELARADDVALLPARPGGLHEEHEGSSEDHHDDVDMHIWLDPENAIAMVGAIADALSKVDPKRADLYRENGAGLRQRLQALDAELREKLAPVRQRPFVVLHDAYQYFERRYGLKALGAIAVDPERRPGAKRLRAIRARIEELGAVCVFAEPQFEPALVDSLIEGTRARKGVLDPLGADLDAGPDQYFQLMRNLADALVTCLGEAG